MAIFEEALRKGIDAHSRAAAARREMDVVLAQASREVSSVLGVPVELGFNQTALAVAQAKIRQIDNNLTGAAVPDPSEKIFTLTARAPSGQSAVLARVELGDIGYPVHLRWGNHVAYADDRGGFESALAELLGSASTGEKIAALGSPSAPGPSPGA